MVLQAAFSFQKLSLYLTRPPPLHRIQMGKRARRRIAKFLSENGVIQRDVSGELAQYYTYDLLSRATGKTPAQLGINQ